MGIGARGSRAVTLLPRGHVAGRAPHLSVGYKNCLTTLLHWAHSFIGRGRAERVITRRN